MNKIKSFSIPRSSTKQELPNIKEKTQRINRESSYLSRIEPHISGNAEYDEMDKKEITKEAIRLKNLLYQINQDTGKIISNFVPRSNRKTHRKNATSVLAIRTEEAINNTKIAEMCKVEVLQLQERVDQIMTYNRQQIDKEIDNTRQQILNLKEEIKGMKVENEKRGKVIVEETKISEEGPSNKIESEVFFALHKVNHLRTDNDRVIEEAASINKRLKYISSRFVEAENYFKETGNENKEELRENEILLIEKKAALEMQKKKTEFYKQNLQYKYFKLLRDLEASTNTLNETKNKVKNIFDQFCQSEEMIIKLENHLYSTKQRQKDEQKGKLETAQTTKDINEFLTNSFELKHGTKVENEMQGKDIILENKKNTEKTIENVIKFKKQGKTVKVNLKEDGEGPRVWEQDSIRTQK